MNRVADADEHAALGESAAAAVRGPTSGGLHCNLDKPSSVAVSIGVGMLPLIAPKCLQWMPHAIHPLIGSGILLASLSAVLSSPTVNGARGDARLQGFTRVDASAV